MPAEFRLYLLKDCLINPVPVKEPAPTTEAVPLLGLFVPKLIEISIGAVATLLKKAGATETAQAIGHETADFYIGDKEQVLRMNDGIGCILGIWGTFRGSGGKPTPPEDAAVRRLEDAGLVPKNSDIGIIFEAALQPTNDQTAFCLDTRHFSVREFMGDRKKDERAFVITLSVTTPGATPDGETIALGNIDMGRLKRGADLVPGKREADAYPRYRSNLMPWRQITQASKAVYDADVAAGRAAGRRYMPVTFNLTISETADGNKLLLTLGELLDANKDKAATEISKLIVPEDRAKADADRAEAAEKLYEAELDAELAVRQAQKAYDAGADVEKPILRVQLEGAKRKRERQTNLRKAAG